MAKLFIIIDHKHRIDITCFSNTNFTEDLNWQLQIHAQKQRIAHKEFKKQIAALPISRKPTTDFVATIRDVRPRTEYIEYRNSREPTEPMNEFEKKTERKSRSSRTRSDGCDVVAII